jgi:hypothetical protein
MMRVLSLVLIALLSFANVAAAQECESPPPPQQGDKPTT